MRNGENRKHVNRWRQVTINKLSETDRENNQAIKTYRTKLSHRQISVSVEIIFTGCSKCLFLLRTHSCNIFQGILNFGSICGNDSKFCFFIRFLFWHRCTGVHVFGDAKIFAQIRPCFSSTTYKQQVLTMLRLKVSIAKNRDVSTPNTSCKSIHVWVALLQFFVYIANSRQQLISRQVR